MTAHPCSCKELREHFSICWLPGNCRTKGKGWKAYIWFAFKWRPIHSPLSGRAYWVQPPRPLYLLFSFGTKLTVIKQRAVNFWGRHWQVFIFMDPVNWLYCVDSGRWGILELAFDFWKTCHLFDCNCGSSRSTDITCKKSRNQSEEKKLKRLKN